MTELTVDKGNFRVDKFGPDFDSTIHLNKIKENIVSASHEKPNILFICTDQQRWDTLGRFKPENLCTPNFDKLLASGVHLTNAFCQSPVCIPSRASMLSGQYPSQTGIYHNTGTLPSDKNTWASVLSDSGYETICVGRSHGIDQGFCSSIRIPFGDSFFDMSANLNGPEQKWSYGYYDYKHLPHVYEGDFDDYMDVRCVKTACHALHDLKDTHKPWAMYLGLLAPHNPYIIPKKYSELYRANDFPEPKVFEEDFHKPTYDSKKLDFWNKFTPNDVMETRKLYFSMVSMVDELVGMVMEQLNTLGLTENTIVVLTSDHGEMNGDHGMWAKINFYEESVKIPCLVSFPKMFDGGREVDALVEAVDFMPTLLDLAGVESPNSASGKSFKGLLTGDSSEHKSAISSTFFEVERKVRYVRTNKYCCSYGYKAEEGLTGELYDMQNDPDQRFNLYNDHNYKQIRDELIEKMLEMEIEHSYQLHLDKPELAWKQHASQHLS